MITFEQANAIHEQHPTIIGRKTFGNAVLFDYYYKDYQLFNTVPGIRDLRGAVFIDGELASLPFHAFFNVGESKAELSFSGYYSEKQDGSMLQVSSHRGQLIVGSRASLEGYVAREAPISEELAAFAHENDEYTFLFEFLDPGHMIVLRHTKPELVFLAARSKVTGEYRHDFSPPGTTINEVMPLTPEIWGRIQPELDESSEREGVVMFTDGDFWKYKIDWYLGLHRLTSDRRPSNYLAAWADGTLDDSLAVLNRYGRDDVIEEILSSVNSFVGELTDTLHQMVKVAAAKTTAKDIALSLERSTIIETMVFAEVMSAFRDNRLDDLGVMFQNIRSRFDKGRFKKYLREED